MLSYNDSWDPDAHFILDGIYHGCHMVDPGASLQSYHMENYGLALSNRQCISELLAQEIIHGKVSVAETKPTRIHSLGAILKPSGKICLLQIAAVQKRNLSIIIGMRFFPSFAIKQLMMWYQLFNIVLICALLTFNLLRGL